MSGLRTELEGGDDEMLDPSNLALIYRQRAAQQAVEALTIGAPGIGTVEGAR